MVLATGTRLGPYEVIAPIGAGGMGEVYKATDTNLKRAVAIKVLPAAVAADTERLARFQREAEVLASLNHPNIAAIYGLERSGITSALVMELVDGPTLADRIARGPVPIGDALPIAKQIAEALEAAHEQGIIHRDLKPANVKVRPDGTVKVLDFGLAKSIEPAAGAATALSMSPTVTSPEHGRGAMTHDGVIIGTAAYMSPEQARGMTVDESSDVWAFGVVLWEMLTGRRLFEGATASDTLASILKTDPDWQTLGPAVPTTIRTLLRRCLQKDRKARLDSARAARLEIEDALTAPAADTSATATRPVPVRRWTRVLPWLLVPIGVIAGIFVPSLNPPRDNDLHSITQFQIPAPKGAEFGNFVSLSPDGRAVVFGAGGQLWIRAMDALDARPLPGSERAGSPFWSPDSRYLGFAQQGKLKIVDVASGVSRLVCELAEPGVGASGASWSREGVILFSNDNRLWRVAATGGQPSVLDPSVMSGERWDRWPVFLPDGRHFLFLMRRGEDTGIQVGSLESPHQRESGPLLLFEAGARPGNFSYIPSPDGRSGYLLFMPENTLLAQRFDVNTFTLAGDAFPVVDGVAAGGSGVGAFSTAANGSLAYRSGAELRQMTWFDRKGQPVDSTAQLSSALTLSPEGQRAVADLKGALWLWEFGADVKKTLLVANPPAGRNPVWSRDGRQIAFARDGNLYRMPSGGGKQELLLEGSPQKNLFPTDWSEDGRFLLYSGADPGTRRNIWALPLTGDDRTPRPVANTEANEQRGQFSPDGRWIAYSSDKSESTEIYVQAFSSTNSTSSDAPIVVSTGGGDQPRWRRDGRELFYRSQIGFWAVTVDTGQAFRRGVPTLLFSAGFLPSPGDNNAYYDVTRDGERFLVTRFAPGNLTAPVTVILNWTSSLK